MTSRKKLEAFKVMTYEDAMVYFAKQSDRLRELLTLVDSPEQLNVALNSALGDMWEDIAPDKHIVTDIRAYLLTHGCSKEDLNPTNTQKGWQRRKETRGIEVDSVEKARAWLASVPQKVSRLFRRQ